MRMMPLALGLFLSLSLSARAQEESRPLELSQVPMKGKAPGDFVPQGWKLEASVQGDLDKNGSEDVVLQLIEARPEEDADGTPVERSRALLALLREGGEFRRAGASNRVLYCTTCQGMLGGGERGVVKLQKGVILVNQLRGSREMVSTTLRFRYDAKAGRFALIGEDVELTDRLTGGTTSQSTNVLTGARITEKRQYSEKKNKDVVLSSKKEKVPVSKRFLEDVDIDQVGSELE
ncbi:hypothetical protein [Archangium sp.]|uniref:hypothetical protein n=1 Tax=Archangium sp. TaxID=1872627 RepID=UPI00286D3B5C|nr:hypothetical protein [Archangium sp.]